MPNPRPSANNRFVISAASKGTLWFNLVSLFPPTYHDRANGNRVDLMQLLADLNPAFLRFPGGNYLEGDTVAQRFPWETTLGDLEQRPGHRGPWDIARPTAWACWNSSIGARTCTWSRCWRSLCRLLAPPRPHRRPARAPALSCKRLDEIEYATGATTTKWARAALPTAIPIRSSSATWKSATKTGSTAAATTAASRNSSCHQGQYPNLQCIATAPVHSRVPDVIDDHYYRTARRMELDVHHYDKTFAHRPKIFVGEWATSRNPDPHPQRRGCRCRMADRPGTKTPTSSCFRATRRCWSTSTYTPGSGART